MHLLQPMAKIMLGVLAFSCRALRRPDLARRARPCLAPSLEAFFFWLETGCFLSPSCCRQRRRPAQSGPAVPGRRAIMLGGILLRINGFLIGYDTGLGVDHGWNYFPSIAEMLVTIGMFAHRSARLHHHHPPLPGAAARSAAAH
jgi:Ni/Fe-hydrogenase subunit HybB-like protein